MCDFLVTLMILSVLSASLMPGGGWLIVMRLLFGG